MNGGELLTQQDLFAVVLQAFAIHLALDFSGPIERRLHRAETRDDVLGAFIANARAPGNVVDSIAFQRQQIGYLGSA